MRTAKSEVIKKETNKLKISLDLVKGPLLRCTVFSLDNDGNEVVMLMLR